ncbi:MAG: ABC transporter permease [Ferrimicrobium sp.]
MAHVISTEGKEGFGLSPAQTPPRRSRKRRWHNGIGVVPFVVYLSLFLVVPAVSVIAEAFRSSSGALTMANISAASHGVYLESFVASIQLSFAAALISAVVGLLTTLALVSSNNRILRAIVTSGSAVFANTGGVPLAFSFIATVGNFGLITKLLSDAGFNLYNHGFSLYSILGLTIVYQYFLVPLMILIMIPPVEALRQEWVDASSSLGGTRLQFWRWVGIPLLFPPLFAAFIVLFTDAFAAYATAEALTSGTIPLVPIQLGALISGNVLANQANLGDALGAGMILIVVIAGALYVYVQRKAARWLR